MDCDNGCGMKGLTAEFLQEHKQYQCPYESVRCPNDCGARLNRIQLASHLDSWHGSCPSRLVRCPSNLVGWKVLVVRDETAAIPLLNTHSEFEESTAHAGSTVVEVEALNEDGDAVAVSGAIGAIGAAGGGADASTTLKRGRDSALDAEDSAEDSDVLLCVSIGRWQEPAPGLLELGTVEAEEKAERTEAKRHELRK